jgi:hypothetical protein
MSKRFAAALNTAAVLLATTVLTTTVLGRAPSAAALEWQDTAISWRAGSEFAEPFNGDDIHKNIVALTHASGYAYGSNFFNADLLLSDDSDPRSYGSTSGAREVYVVYRHLLDLGKVLHTDFQFGPVRGFGISAGFDANDKSDAGYNSRKRMLVLGPTLMLDTPGFVNVSVLQLWESNHPSVSAGAFDPGYPSSRYHYDPHPMLSIAWGIPLGDLPLSFEGYANFIAGKGHDEVGRDTASETNIDMQIMYAIDAAKQFRVGLEYQYWKNKFGNSDRTVGDLGGNLAKTPMIRAEYHFR